MLASQGVDHQEVRQEEERSRKKREKLQIIDAIKRQKGKQHMLVFVQ